MRLRYEAGFYLCAVPAAIGLLWLALRVLFASDAYTGTQAELPGRKEIAILLMLGAPPVSLGLWLMQRAREAHAAAKAAGYRACIACGHSMAGLADSGPCPECGRFFLVEESRAYWDRVLDLRKR